MHYLRRLALVSTAVVALGASASPALASTQPASGSFIEGPETITSAQFAGPNQIYTLTREFLFTGTFEGVGQAEQRIVIRKDGSATLQMTIAFTGSACGEPAALTLNVSASIDFATGMSAGHFAVTGAGGDQRVSGVGTFSGAAATTGSYDGMIKCS